MRPVTTQPSIKETASLTTSSTITSTADSTSIAASSPYSSSSRSIGAFAFLRMYSTTRHTHQGPPSTMSSTIRIVCHAYQNAPAIASSATAQERTSYG
jgi:hypothetical protein